MRPGGCTLLGLVGRSAFDTKPIAFMLCTCRLMETKDGYIFYFPIFVSVPVNVICSVCDRPLLSIFVHVRFLFSERYMCLKCDI